MQNYLFTAENVINHFQAKSYEELEQLTQEEVFDYFKARLLVEKEAEEKHDLAIMLDGKNYPKTAADFQARSRYMENMAEVEPYSHWLIYRDETGAIRYSEKAGATDHSGLFKRHSSLARGDYSPAQAVGEFAREANRLEPHYPDYSPDNHF